MVLVSIFQKSIVKTPKKGRMFFFFQVDSIGTAGDATDTSRLRCCPHHWNLTAPPQCHPLPKKQGLIYSPYYIRDYRGIMVVNEPLNKALFPGWVGGTGFFVCRTLLEKNMERGEVFAMQKWHRQISANFAKFLNNFLNLGLRCCKPFWDTKHPHPHYQSLPVCRFYLGGGFRYFLCSPYLGKWSNLTSICFKWVETTN